MIVSINTQIPEYNGMNYKFHFDSELIVENHDSIQDKDAVDFPIAIIAFNPNHDVFLPIKEYSRNIKSSLFDESLAQISYSGLSLSR